jgi:hypothetical protein
MVTAAGPIGTRDASVKSMISHAEIAKAGARLNSLVDSLDSFLNSPAAGRLLPQIENAISRAGDEGEGLIDHTMRQAAILILIWFAAYIIARFILNYFSKKFANASG